jgi:hypothetical protein
MGHDNAYAGERSMLKTGSWKERLRCQARVMRKVLNERKTRGTVGRGFRFGRNLTLVVDEKSDQQRGPRPQARSRVIREKEILR